MPGQANGPTGEDGATQGPQAAGHSDTSKATGEQSESAPLARVDRATPSFHRGTRQVRTWLIHVVCPNGCRDGHVHGSGGPDLANGEGPRVAHCLQSTRRGVDSPHVSRSYNVVIPEELIEKAYADLATRVTA